MTSQVQRTLTFPASLPRRGIDLDERPVPTTMPTSPPPLRGGRFEDLFDKVAASQSIWVIPVLIAQAVMCFRLSARLSGNEAVYLRTGHLLIAHLLHGTPTAGIGPYLSGIPSLYAVPAAMLDRLGGVWLVHLASTGLIFATTVFVYLASRKLFGQGPALIAACVFAANPAAIVAGRTASFDAPSLLLLSIALFLATRATTRIAYPVVMGALAVIAAPEQYFALIVVPGLIAITALAGRTGTVRRIAITGAVTVASAVMTTVIVILVLSNQHWQGPASSVVGDALGPSSRIALLHSGWSYVGPLALAAAAAIFVLRGARVLAAAVLATSVVPLLVQIDLHQSATLHRNTAYCALFLAPLAGVAGMWLVRRGNRLALRAPIALAAVILALSSGFGATAAAVDNWPLSIGFDNIIRSYVQPGYSTTFLDASAIPPDELSQVAAGHNWVGATAPRFLTPSGSDELLTELENGNFSLVLYSLHGGKPTASRSILVTLHDRYTLLAKVPVTSGNTHTYLSLWLAELPR